MEQYLLTTYVFCLIFTIVCYICALTSFLWFYHLRKLYTYIHIFLYTLMTLFCRKFYVQKKLKRWIYLFTFLICHKLRGLKEKERKHTEKYNLTLLYKYPSFLWDYLTLFYIFFSDFTGFPFIRGGDLFNTAGSIATSVIWKLSPGKLPFPRTWNIRNGYFLIYFPVNRQKCESFLTKYKLFFKQKKYHAF